VTALLEVHELAKAYGGVHAVRGVSLSVASGEIVAFIGPNGAGKSTCFNMLNGQIRPDAGTIRLDGRDIAGWPPREVWRLGVGRTFQITATFASMSVIENVQMVFLSHAGRLGRLWGLATLAERERAEILAALESVDAVVIFDAPTPRELIAALLPDVLVKGGDWPGDQIVGREEVEAAGGRVVSIPVVPGYSTTAILRKIREGAPSSRVEA